MHQVAAWVTGVTQKGVRRSSYVRMRCMYCTVLCTLYNIAQFGVAQGVTKICHLSWLTNSDLVYETKCGGRGKVAGSQPMSTAVHRTKINCGDLTPYLTYMMLLDNFPCWNLIRAAFQSP